LASFIIKS